MSKFFDQSSHQAIKSSQLLPIQVGLVSVVIVTRNRAKTLSVCLASLVKQTVQPIEYIIVDNDSTDLTTEVIAEFSQTLKSVFNHRIKAKRVLEKRVGYPVVYNRGLREASQPWVIFIDDDCIADANWLATYVSEINAETKSKLSQALVGQSQTQIPTTIWSLAVLAMDQFWKRSVINDSNQVLDLETLDNKNVAYFKPFLVKHHLKFNEAAMQQPGGGAAEDADLGMQLMTAGAVAKYLPKALIWHQDPNRIVWFFRRLKAGAVANFYYQNRWQVTRIKLGCVRLRSAQKFKDFWPKFCRDQQLTGLKSWLVLIIVWISFWLVNKWQRDLVKNLKIIEND